jgi:thiol-disulfide isomerase/thioredoxin
MKGIFLNIVALTAIISQVSAQENPYKFKVEGVKDTVVYLANYYGEKLYYADTAWADDKGRFSFKAIPEENQGKYAVVVPGPKYFEIVIADNEEIEITSDTTNLVQNVTVVKSENNKIMYEYMDYLTERRKEREVIVKQLEEFTDIPEKTAPLKIQYNALNDRVVQYQTDLGKEYPNRFAAQEILMSVEPQPPVEIEDDKVASYYFYKNHYFDNINLKDDRIVRTPVFHNRLVNYLNNTIATNPDTLIVAIDDLVSQLEPGSEVYKYVVHYTTYNFETSKIMGMDKVFVHMVDTYYKTGNAFWMEDDKLEAILEKADTKRYTLIGLKAPELILQDSTGAWISTFKDVPQEYVVLYFYNPDCGHCKKETPKLVEFYESCDQENIMVYAVSSDNSEKWNKFIKDYNMDFINVTIPAEAFENAEFATNLIRTGKTNYHSLKFQESFDVYSTPKIIILDKDRIILAKDIGVEQIQPILDRFINPDTEKEASSTETE